MKAKVFLILTAMLVFILGPGVVKGWPVEPDEDRGFTMDLTELSLEELMNLTITSVSRKEQKLFEAASAIHVITREDIRRSGATSIPEALRMVPGIQVAQIDASKWAISCRGFNNRFANKLLVLIDGRSVYTPLFSGVYWDVQDMMLEDVDRIEIIRGPGGTVWGANAVNGVINVITRKAGDTQGSLVTGGFGTEERGFGGIRYGGKAGEEVSYRVYGKYFNRDEFLDTAGHRAADDWDVLRGGFRADWEVSGHDSLTLQGDIYDGDAGQTVPSSGSLVPPFWLVIDDEVEIFGGNVRAYWSHDFSEKSDMTFQLYYDRTERVENTYRKKRDTVDFDFHHRFEFGEHQEVVWGAGYRFTTDETHESMTFSVDPDSRDLHLVSSFVQDEISLFDDRLFLTIGSKLEHNDYTGFEIQPSIRILGQPHEDHRVWAAASRAVRTPSRIEDDVRINYLSYAGSGGTFQRAIIGGHDIKAEDLLALELGYRVRAKKRVFLDSTVFYNFYDDLKTGEPGVPFYESTPSPSHTVIPQYYDNEMHGETYGAEVAVNWEVMDRWKLSAAYTWLKMQLDLSKSSADYDAEQQEDQIPQNQIHLRSYFELPHHLEFDTAVYYVDNLFDYGVSSYTRLDTRLGWSPVEELDIDFVFQNLLDGEHQEHGFGEELYQTEVQRSMYGKLTWHF